MSSPEESGRRLDAARQFLRRLIQAQGITLQDLDKRLGFTRGYVSRLLHGETRLTYQHILEILEAIDIDPSIYFSTLHPQRQHRREPEALRIEELRELVSQLHRILPAAEESIPALAPPASEEDVEARIQDAVREVLAERAAGPLRE